MSKKNYKDVAANLMAEHFKCSKSTASTWGITHKMAAALEDAESFGAANAESNNMVALLTAPVGEKKKEKKVVTAPVVPPVVSTFAQQPVVDPLASVVA